jgi:hypothetical protein
MNNYLKMMRFDTAKTKGCFVKIKQPFIGTKQPLVKIKRRFIAAE